MTWQQLADKAKAFADSIQTKDRSRKEMPDNLNEEMRSIVDAFGQLDSLHQSSLWRDLPTGGRYYYAQAHKWARKIQHCAEQTSAAEHIRPSWV